MLTSATSDLDQALEPLAGRFESFHVTDLIASAERMSAHIDQRRNDAPWIDRDSVVAHVVQDLALALDAVTIRALITDFVVVQKRSGCSYGEHAERVSDATYAEQLYRVYPELARLRRLVVERRERAVLECLDSAIRNRQRIAPSSGTLTSVTQTGGDPHRGGRSVLMVRFGEDNVVFKPASAKPSALLARIRDSVDPDGTMLGQLVPAVLADDGQFSWHEFVAPAPLNEYDVPSYVRRFGAMTALATALGATDLHAENIIATSAGPVIVDVETFTGLTETARPQSVREALGHTLESSVFRTMLVPARFLGASLDVDVSALGTVNRHRELDYQSFRVTGAGTDAIGFATAPVSMPSGHRLHDDGDRTFDPRRWADELVEGFMQMRQSVDTHRVEIQRICEEMGPLEVRVVPRPTRVYARFLEASTHPVYLSDVSDRRRLFEKLGSTQLSVNDDELTALRKAETEALCDLDVPFFTSTDVIGTLDGRPERAVVACWHPAGRRPVRTADSVARVVESHVRAFVDVDPIVHERHVRLSLETSTDDVWRVPSHHWSSQPFPHGPIPDPVHRVTTDDETTWLTAIAVGEGLRLAPLSLAFFEGGGALVAAAMHEPREASEIASAARGAIRHDVAVDAATDPLMLSPFVGAVGEEITRHELRRNGIDVRTAPLIASPLDALPTVELADLDYMGGYAGYLAALARYPTDRGDPEHVTRMVRALLASIGDDFVGSSVPGLAHGLAGRLAALTATHRLTNGDAVIAATMHAALHAFDPESLDLREMSSARSWCRGYPGVLFAVVDAARALSCNWKTIPIVRSAEDALRSARTSGRDVDISLCHGVGGEALTLSHLADVTDEPWLRAAASAARKDGRAAVAAGSWVSGLGCAPRHESFLLGSSGWFLVEAVHRGAPLPHMLSVTA